jgi:hypothetical protein
MTWRRALKLSAIAIAGFIAAAYAQSVFASACFIVIAVLFAIISWREAKSLACIPQAMTSGRRLI